MRVDDAARSDHALFALQDPGRDVLELERLAVDDDRVAGVRAAVVAANEIRVLRKEVDDLPFPLVTPLRADYDSGWHVRTLARAQWGLAGRASKARTSSVAAPPSWRLGAPTMTVAGTSKESARTCG